MECFLCKDELVPSLLPLDRATHSQTLTRLFTFIHHYSEQVGAGLSSTRTHSHQIQRKVISAPQLLSSLETKLQNVDYCIKCTAHVQEVVQTFKTYDLAGQKLELKKDELVGKLRDVQNSTGDDDTNSKLRKEIIDGFSDSPTNNSPTKIETGLAVPTSRSTYQSNCARLPNPVVKLRRIEDFPLFVRQIGKTRSTSINIKEEPVDVDIELCPEVEVNDLDLCLDPSSDQYETHSPTFVGSVGSVCPDLESNSDPEYEHPPPNPKRRRKQATQARSEIKATKSRSKAEKGKSKSKARAVASGPSKTSSKESQSQLSQRRPDPEKRFQRLQHYPCDFGNCSQPFESLPALDDHARLAHAEFERPWRCAEPNCGMEFFKEFSLTHHIHYVHSTAYKYPCPKCLEGFDNYGKYTRHQLENHRGSAIIGVLGKPIKPWRRRRLPADKLKRPQRVHKPVFPCDYEDCEFQGRKELETQTHLETTHPTVPRHFSCLDCDARFIREERLGRHKHWVHSGFRYPCQDCDFACNRGDTIERHQLRVHGRGERCPYEDCDYIGVPYNLKLHLASSVHADRAPDHGQRKHMCQHCGSAFISAQVLKYHIISRHPDLIENPEELKRYRCQHCNIIMGSPFILRNHLRRVHNEGGDRGSFHCDQCEKTFIYSSQLKKHMSSHLDPQEFENECEVCHAKFRHRRALTTHMRRHTGDYKDICNECGKKFIDGHALKRHMKIHAGILKYVCPKCNKGFPVQEYLSIHLRSHLSKVEKEERKKQKFEVPPLQKIYYDLWRKRSTVASVTADPLATEPVEIPEYPMHYNFDRERKDISRVLTPEEMEETTPSGGDGKGLKC